MFLFFGQPVNEKQQNNHQLDFLSSLWVAHNGPKRDNFAGSLFLRISFNAKTHIKINIPLSRLASHFIHEQSLVTLIGCILFYF